jgi:hypothetical protein
VHATIPPVPLGRNRPTLPDLPDHREIGRTIARHDPLWAPQLVVAATLVLDFSLPERVTVGPSWLLPAFEGLLLIGLVAISPHPKLRNSPKRRWIAMGLIGLVSLANIVSLILLCHLMLKGALFGGHHKISSPEGHQLILGGIVLWATNVLLFSLWYWELDRGGPIAREHGTAGLPDFLFPQMIDTQFAPDGWMPTLIDYLYVSFTNATAFSPTDTMPLTPWSKLLMALQSGTSLATLGLVVARAVNILS